MTQNPRTVRTIIVLLLALAALTACGPWDVSGESRECTVRFQIARTGKDTLAILDKPQGPRAIYCGAYLKPLTPSTP